MMINTNLPLQNDSQSAALGRKASGEETPNRGVQQDQASSRLQGLADQDGDLADGTGADQAMSYLRANMISQPGMIYAAQANLNPNSVYNLLQ